MREFAGMLVLLPMLVLPMWGIPKYLVWTSNVAIERLENEGKAKLAKAEQERQIQIAQAKAERDAAELRAEAIGIIGKASQEFPEYRRQEFIGAFADALQNGTINQIIYVPTEGNIPVLEAGKR